MSDLNRVLTADEVMAIEPVDVLASRVFAMGDTAANPPKA